MNTTLRILKELNTSENNGTIFNPFGCPNKIAEVKQAIDEYRNLQLRYDELVDSIKSALKIRALWLPEADVDEEHKSEAIALNSMVSKFSKVLADAGVIYIE